MASRLEVAAQVMEHLCTHDWHGYSQPHREGDGEGYCYITVDGKVYQTEQGDRDCSMAVISALRAAGMPTGGATYTGNLRKCLLSTGDWEWKPMSFIAKRGDLYLNEGEHVAMCLGDDPDIMGEFLISENGTIDGKTGDQTGRESVIRAYKDEGWDGILHCINPYPDAPSTYTEKPEETDPEEDHADALPEIEYRVYTKENGWLDWMKGLTDTGGSEDDFAGVPGHMIRNVQVRNLGPGGWFVLNMRKQGELHPNAENTDMADGVIGITIYYETEDPDKNGVHYAKYRVGILGGSYLKWEYDDEDGGAGDDLHYIDRIQCLLSR